MNTKQSDTPHIDTDDQVNDFEENIEEDVETDVELLRQECLIALKRETVVTYGNILDINGWSVYRLNRALRALSEQNAAEGIPFLTSVIVSSYSREPSVGYWRGWSKLRDESVPYRQQHDKWLVELGKAEHYAKCNNND